MKAHNSIPCTIAFLILFPAMAFATVDIVHGPDYLYVAWTVGGSSVIENWDTGTQVDFDPPDVTVGLMDLGDSDCVVLTASDNTEEQPDSIYLLDPVTLSTLSSRIIQPEDIGDWSGVPPEIICMTIRTTRYCPEEDATYFTALPYAPASGDMQYDVVSARIDAGLTITDTLGVSIDTYAGYVSVYTRPVMSGNGMPVLLWTYFNSYFASDLVHSSGMHQEDLTPSEGSFSPMLYDVFYSPGMGSYGPGYVRALGSCAGHSLGLWTTEDNAELRFSTFDGVNPSPVQTSPWPFSDLLEQPCALSCSPADPGLLLLWWDNGSIMCRHYQGNTGTWNDYPYLVEESAGTVYDGNIAVCSVADGYWAAWLPVGAVRPTVVFIPGSSVTGIGSEGTMPSGTDAIVWPNPCSGVLNLCVNWSGNPVRVDVFDTSGRLVHTGMTGAGGIHEWDTAGEPPGAYLVRAVGPDRQECYKVMIIR